MAKPTPELVFQQHIAHYLMAKHGYGVLTQQDIAPADDGLAEDRLWDFLNATQADSLQKLSADYGSDTRAEIFRALRSSVDKKGRALGFMPFLPYNQLSDDDLKAIIDANSGCKRS